MREVPTINSRWHGQCDSTYLKIGIGHFREQVSVRAEPGGRGLRCSLSSGRAASRAELSGAAGRCAHTQLAPPGSLATPSSEKHFSISTQLCCQQGAGSSVLASYMPASSHTPWFQSQSPGTQQWHVTRLQSSSNMPQFLDPSSHAQPRKPNCPDTYITQSLELV